MMKAPIFQITGREQHSARRVDLKTKRNKSNCTPFAYEIDAANIFHFGKFDGYLTLSARYFRAQNVNVGTWNHVKPQIGTRI